MFHFLYPLVKKRDSALYLGLRCKMEPEPLVLARAERNWFSSAECERGRTKFNRRCSRARTIAFKENLVAAVEHLRRSCYSPVPNPTYVGPKPSLMWG